MIISYPPTDENRSVYTLEIIYNPMVTEQRHKLCRKCLTCQKKASMMKKLKKMGCWVVPAERKRLNAFNPLT